MKSANAPFGTQQERNLLQKPNTSSRRYRDRSDRSDQLLVMSSDSQIVIKDNYMMESI